ncbi:hypothetical protein HZF05_18740 [Sphingomonas sp. CGMCC 1.13654]|uniref:Uncharacterized protein n=1 Tax=Sphingomonas chungangi TaxID=2683589 RepID=A0A838LBN6_9SPHN|nr:hypothetical protein [Sphingomonas chungangi]MBA2936125.1 hypothetical protein [Sphingomonas chungangi]MVW55512.1 hypothetical protein [Sphingomonas chungangi]
MAEDCDKPENSAENGGNDRLASTGRRGVLMLGAVAASSVVTIRPALASTAASVLNCKIPIPDPPHGGKYITTDGKLVAPNTQGAFAPAPRPVTGDEARKMINGQSPAGFDPNARQAYVNYIRRLQHGTSGFTCYASLQMPGR